MKHQKKEAARIARPALLSPNAHHQAHLNESLLKLARREYTAGVPQQVRSYARNQQFVPHRQAQSAVELSHG
jgi:hypothetical protein